MRAPILAPERLLPRLVGGLLFAACSTVAPVGGSSQLELSAYERLVAPKALAQAFENNPRLQRVVGWASGQPDLETAKAKALEECERVRSSSDIRVPCRVIAVNDQFI